MVIHGSRMRTSSYLSSNRRQDLKNQTRNLSDFIAAVPFAPCNRSEVWTLTYDVEALNWTLSGSVSGAVSQRVEFEGGVAVDSFSLEMGPHSFFGWNGGDWIAFTDQQPNIQTTNDATVVVDGLLPANVVYGDGSAYRGPLTLVSLVGRVPMYASSYGGAPYYISIDNWIVQGSVYSISDHVGKQAMAYCPGYVSDPVDIRADGLAGQLVLHADSDGDWLSDDLELIYGTNPLVADCDRDGLSDWEEIYMAGTNPLLDDTDSDGVNDGLEIADGTSPVNPNEYLDRPPIITATAGYIQSDVAPMAMVSLQRSPMRTTSSEDNLLAATVEDVIGVAVEGEDPDGDPFIFEYRWLINDEMLAEADANTLDACLASKGDEVTVEVRAVSNTLSSEWVSAAAFRIGNATPIISVPASVVMSAGEQVKITCTALDSDGDALVIAPEPASHGSLSVNENVITYVPEWGYYGSDLLVVKVQDVDGAWNMATISIDVRFKSDSAIESYLADHMAPELYSSLAVSSREADPDGDLYTNLQEYFFGLDPVVPDRVAAVQYEQSEGSLFMKFLLNRNLGPENIKLLKSTDLTNWSPEDVTPNLLGQDEDRSTYRYQIALPDPSVSQFFRVEYHAEE
jgi:hypothetical protein